MPSIIMVCLVDIPGRSFSFLKGGVDLGERRVLGMGGLGGVEEGETSVGMYGRRVKIRSRKIPSNAP